MKKYIFFLCLALICLCVPLEFVGQNSYAQNDIVQTSQDFILIENEHELKNVNGSNSYKLKNDIVLTENWTPLGANSLTNTYQSFGGVFDGGGYTIKGLKLDMNYGEYQYWGLFSLLENANIKNLKIEVVYLSANKHIQNISSLSIGGLAGEITSSTLENCIVEFVQDNQTYNDQDNLQFSVNTKNSLYFGGLVGRCSSGSLIKNCYAITNAYITKDAIQGVSVAIGGLVGDLSYGKLRNNYAVCDYVFQTVQAVNPSLSVSIGGLVGCLRGTNCEMLSNYASFSSVVLSEQDVLIGVVIGKIEQSLTPITFNLNYLYGYSNCKINNVTTAINVIADNGYYSLQNCNISSFPENNFSVFTNNSLWSTIYSWDFENVWSVGNNDFPSLQIFKTYEVSLNRTPIIDFGILQARDVATIEFADESISNLDRINPRFSDTVLIKIKINEEFKQYFKLENIMLATSIIYNLNSPLENDSSFKVTVPVDDEQEPVNYYLLEYKCNDKTDGQISFSLGKIDYTLNVATQNATMGKVRNQFTSTPTHNFSQTISYGNTYNFFAVATSNNFAFSNWIFDFADEEKENYTMEGISSNFNFVFGQTGIDVINYDQYIIDGANLVAEWTSNICNVEVISRLKNGENSDGCIIKDASNNTVDGGFATAKKKAFVLTAQLKDGFEFEGWYDQSGRLIGNSLTLNYTPEETEDELTVVARLSVAEKVNDLTWLWITLGVVGGLIILAIIIIVIVKRKGDRSYRNYY